MGIIGTLYEQFVKYQRVTTDSRSIEKGAIFFALKGDNFNGNHFALDALSKGAEIAVVDDINLKNKKGCIYTEDVLLCLQKLAKYHREQLSIPIIGLTGSNGKTTTKELIRQALACKYKVVATQGNLNNHIGVPLTLLSISKSDEIAIIEMGANHVGEIQTLCNIAQPTFGLITNIGRAHIGGFGGFEGVIKAKTELFGYMKDNNGTIFFNADNDLINGKISEFNLSKSSIDYSIKSFNAKTIPGREPFLSVSLSFPNNNYLIHTNLTGSYNLENILAACRIATHFGVEPKMIKESIESYTPSNSRSQVVDTPQNRVILDAYNANPSSMEAALANFASLPSDKGKVAIIGEMLELGEYADAEHNRIVGIATRFDFEQILLVGTLFPKSHPATKWFETSQECLKYLKRNPQKEKLILVKGSRGTRMEVVMDAL